MSTLWLSFSPPNKKEAWVAGTLADTQPEQIRTVIFIKYHNNDINYNTQ